MNPLHFQDLSLSQEIQQAVAEMGFTEPSAIQLQAIPLLLAGSDLIGQAQTGTGKTAAFAIPTLEKIKPNLFKPQTLVLCPTRELANQVAEEFKKLGKYKKGIHTAAVYGGESIGLQIKALRRGVHIVIGTPGRIIDHIERGTLDLENINQIILDEADEMLNMGFIDDIEKILSHMPAERQTVFFSATMPAPILALTKKYQKNPQIVKVTPKQLTNLSIDQSFYKVRNEHKTELLYRLVELHNLKSIVVFCNTKQQVDELVGALQQHGLIAEALHGDLRQNQRNQVMAKFRTGGVNVLVATDVAARGIDVENVEAVINYDTPLDPEYYVHRIGRTGRAGKSGKSFTFVNSREMGRIWDIERFASIKIAQGKIPSLQDVWVYRQSQFAERIQNEIEKGDLEYFQEMIGQIKAEGGDLETITAALLKMHLGTPRTGTDLLLEEPKRTVRVETKEYGNRTERGGNDRYGRDRTTNTRSSSSSYSSRSDRPERGERTERSGSPSDRPERRERYSSAKGNSDMVRLFFNLGKQQRISKSDILGAITGETGIRGSLIGSIDIFDKYSFVDIAQIEAQNVLKTMNQVKIKGKKVNVELAGAFN